MRLVEIQRAAIHFQKECEEKVDKKSIILMLVHIDMCDNFRCKKIKIEDGKIFIASQQNHETQCKTGKTLACFWVE